jgi:hypothetical protein
LAVPVTGRPSSQELADRVRGGLRRYTFSPLGEECPNAEYANEVAALDALAARLQAAEQALREIRDEVMPVMTHTGITHTSKYGYEASLRARRALEGAAE